MRLRAMAKINLGLDVLRKREDGYHEVRMIMQTIRMYDQLDLRRSSREGIRLQTNRPYLPTDENNLVYKAARLLMDEFQVKGGLDIKLEKFIPVAAGMAGGSSDAAAAMIGVNRLFHLDLSLEELMERGVKIGADVPYCLMRGTALAEGIGEKLTALAPMPECFILIGKPAVSVSTRFVYGNLKADQIKEHPDVDSLIHSLEAQDLPALCASMGNVLEEVTIPAYPVIQGIREQMMQCGALQAMMSGSGPTVFGIFDSYARAKEACARLRRGRLAKQVFLTTPYNNGGVTNDD